MAFLLVGSRNQEVEKSAPIAHCLTPDPCAIFFNVMTKVG